MFHGYFFFPRTCIAHILLSGMACSIQLWSAHHLGARSQPDYTRELHTDSSSSQSNLRDSVNAFGFGPYVGVGILIIKQFRD
jgi:hypothetical protein